MTSRTVETDGAPAPSLLDRRLAQRIVDRVMENLDRNVCVVGVDGHILAGGDHSRPGAYHPVAAAVMYDGQIRTVTPEEASTDDAVRSGVSAPLYFAGERVGVIVVNGDLALVHELVRVVAALAELILYQELVIERLPDREQAGDDVIAGLLEHGVTDEASALSRAHLLGLDLTVPRLVVLFSMPGAPASDVPGRFPALNQSSDARQRRSRVMRAVRAGTGWGDETPLAMLDAETLVALRRTAPRRDVDGAGAACELSRDLEIALVSLAARLEADVRAGVGRYHPGLSGLAASYHDATMALRIGRRVAPDRRVYLLDDLGAAAFVGPLDAQTKAAMAERLLHPLERHPDLFHTLEVFLANGLMPAATATVLVVHRNTLNYRLNRIHELVGLDPRRFDGAFLLRLALLARDVYA